MLSNKRPGYYQGNDGLPTKRPRISHYKKPETNSGSSNAGENGRTAGSGSTNSVNSVVAGGAGGNSASGGSGGGSGVSDGWDQRQHQRDRRNEYRAERTANSDVLRGGNYVTGKPCMTPTSDSEETSQIGHRDAIVASTGTSGSSASNNAANSHNSHSSVAHSSSLSGSRHHHAGKSATSGADGNGATSLDYAARSMPSVVVSEGGSAGSYSGSSNGILAERRDRSDRNDRGRGSDRDRETRKRNNAASSNTYTDLTTSDYAGNEDNTVTTSTCSLDLAESPKSSEYPDYLT